MGRSKAGRPDPAEMLRALEGRVNGRQRLLPNVLIHGIANHANAAV
jgi:hypothetical protein